MPIRSLLVCWDGADRTLNAGRSLLVCWDGGDRTLNADLFIASILGWG